MEPPVLLIEPARTPRAVTLTLNRPKKRNALTLPLLYALREAVATAPERFPAARAVILRGAGPAFCAGMDLAETGGDPHATAAGVRDVFLALANCPLPTVAVVQGAAVAGGLGLVLACDFSVVLETAPVGLPEVRRGLVAALVAVLLRRRVAGGDAAQMLLGGGVQPARDWYIQGLFTRVTPAEPLDLDVADILGAVAAGAPGALAATKRLLLDLAPRSLEEDCRLALLTHEAARDSGEAREGAAAFLEKRAPAWAV